MGIQGLIPFLEKTSRPISISEFSGCTVAIDAYCWLHKGAFSCAEKLARGEKCDAYVYYCMKYINMLLSHNIKPIMVFDGQHLPAKADTEKKRRENREVNRRRAAELLRQDKPNEARTYIRRCVDITHGMALELMHACRAINVDCVTAPYEADAQLAYLNLTGIAHVVITEDSDLILFGCKKVVFKLDPNGGGLLVEQEKLHLSMKSRPENYSFEKFRRMCILSGCDYLPSLPGIGLTKACRFITRTMDPEIERALTRMSSYLNMPQLVVTKEYIKNFVHAEAMFKHQPVFDPIERKLVPLTPIEDTTPQLRLPEPLPQDQAYQLALGNLDPFSLKVVSDWDPDDRQNAKPKWGTSKQASHRSIWAANFEITEPKFRPVKARLPRSTAGKQTIQDPKIELETSNFIDDKDIENMLFDCDENMEISTQPFKKVCLSNEKETESKNEMEVVEEGDNRKSPILSTKMDAKSKLVNKFKKQRNTVLDEKVTVQSRYFNSSPSSANTSTNSPSKLAVNPISDTSGSNSDKETLKDISSVLNETVNKDDEAVRKTSPKKSDDSKVAAEIMMTVQNSPTRKYSENSFSPGKRSSKIVTIRNSLLTELSLEEGKEKDNDSGVSCPNSFELDVVEECSQSSARNGSSISAFTWKQKFHEKFGFKNNSVAEKVLQSSKAVDSGFQSPSSCRNEPESSNRLGKSDNCATPKTPVSASRRSNPFKVDSSHKNDAINSTPKFNLLRDSVIDYQADQDIKDQISELASTPVKPQQFVGFETQSQKSGKSPLESDKPEESPLGSSKLDKSPFGSNKPDKSPFGSSKPIKSPFGSNSKTKTSGNLKQSSSIKGKCRSVGLGKKSTPNSSSDSSQRSLLSMFALQPKPKLECK